jgi:hypothetical protein
MGSLVSDVVGIFTGADDTREAANRAAAQQSQAARDAAAAAAFRPVGMTSRFGSSSFTREVDPATGIPYIASAGYQTAPELSNLQDRLFRQFGSGLTGAEQMAAQYQPIGVGAQQVMNLGQQYLAQSPEQAAAQYMQQQQGLLAGGREQQLSNIRNNLFQRGRSGLATGATGTGMQATNPEMAAYYNALAQQDAALAAQATQAGQQRTQFGAGLLGTGAGLLGSQVQGTVGAYAPLQTQLGLANQIEQMAMQPYNMGLQLGTSQGAINSAAAGMFNQGQQAAAQTRYQGEQAANAANAQFLSSLIGSAAGGMTGGAGGAAAGGGMFSSLGNAFGNPLTAMSYGTNLGSQQTRMLAAQDAGFNPSGGFFGGLFR